MCGLSHILLRVPHISAVGAWKKVGFIFRRHAGGWNEGPFFASRIKSARKPWVTLKKSSKNTILPIPDLRWRLQRPPYLPIDRCARSAKKIHWKMYVLQQLIVVTQFCIGAGQRIYLRLGTYTFCNKLKTGDAWCASPFYVPREYKGFSYR